MPLFLSLPDTPHLLDVFQAFPHQVAPLLAYHDALLRSESPLTIAERELIAAYVSGLNACQFCFGAHRIYAKAFGIADDVIDQLLKDVDTASIDDKLKPILRYVKKLNHLPTQLIDADAQAVYEVGWSERALYDAVQICGLFNCMNRIIEGTGVSFDFAAHLLSSEELEARKASQYADFAQAIGLGPNGS